MVVNLAAQPVLEPPIKVMLAAQVAMALPSLHQVALAAALVA
jgi:hypothetical protein